VQNPQNTALSQTDLTTNSVSSSITTVGGKQVVSMQLLQQSGLNFDEVILGDLAADYAKQLDTQWLSGTGANGQLRGVTGAAGATVTYTDASPAVAGAGKFYAQVAKAIQTVETTRYAPPDTILMHPRRWAWLTASFDGNNRPLIVPSSNGYNAIGTPGAVKEQGLVGEVLGLPVYTDPNIATNLGAGTNQDTVYVLKASDLWLWETAVQAEAFTATYADSMGVLFRLFAYSASIPDRYAASICLISGTGLVTPAF
jgi:HK97 family phage major capsid protein